MLNISIVLYKTRAEQLLPLLDELLKVRRLHRIYLIDNSPVKSEEFASLPLPVEYIFNNANLGYGKAHNIALRQSVYDEVPFHLVINSDIEVKAADIDYLLDFIGQNPLIGQIMPKVVYPDGTVQYLAKLLPTPWDLIARRFLPGFLTRKRTERYELRFTGYNRPLNAPYLSGCFMLLRTQAAYRAHLFDERFFMYPEDLDLTRTIHVDYLTLFLPSVTIVHHHTKASYHSLRYLWIHIVNMCRYFNKWGWFRDVERDDFNRQLLDSLKD